MDIVAYGGAAIGMAVAVSEFLTKVSKNSPSSTGEIFGTDRKDNGVFL